MPIINNYISWGLNIFLFASSVTYLQEIFKNHVLQKIRDNMQFLFSLDT